MRDLLSYPGSSRMVKLGGTCDLAHIGIVGNTNNAISLQISESPKEVG
jgi:hypothetical protein